MNPTVTDHILSIYEILVDAFLIIYGRVISSVTKLKST